jgi:anti-sigma B factor antagonist
MEISRPPVEMALPARAVTVKRLPAELDWKRERLLLRELEDGLAVSRPSIVLDLSEAGRIDKPYLHLLLSCLEEAMKRNGDVRLASLRPEVRSTLRLSGVDRLFAIFETRAAAIESFQGPSCYSPRAADEDPKPAEDAA